MKPCTPACAGQSAGFYHRVAAALTLNPKPETLKQGKAQGFTTGSLLRVTPEEFHREMRRYMPVPELNLKP